MKFLHAWLVCCQAALLSIAPLPVLGGDPTPMFHRAEPLVNALKSADAAHDDKRAEELCREILKLPMDPAEQEYLRRQLTTPMLWLRDHGRLEAWLADAEKELEMTPGAKHLQWFVALGWEYAGYFTHETFTIELGKARPPVWLRVRREGAKRTAAMSQDGKEWIEKDIVGWRSDKPFLWGFSSTQMPLDQSTVPAAFQPFTMEPSPPADTPWIFEKPLPSGFTVGAKHEPVPSIELRPMATRMDVLMDSGWLLHREIKGDATFTARVDAPAPHHESGLHVALWAGHYAPRLFLRLDDDGVVRCTMRRQDTRDAIAYLRLAQLCPELGWVQAEAAGKLAVLGLHAEAFPIFERLLDRDFVAAIQGDIARPLITSYFEAGRADELARRMLKWQPTPEIIAKEEVPFNAYESVASKLAEEKKWDLSLQVAYRAMQWPGPKDGYFRRLALKVVNCLEAMDQRDAISAVILDGLFGHALEESRGKARAVPPNWINLGGWVDDEGPWNATLGLIFAAQKHHCGPEVWQIVRKFIPADETEPYFRLSRVLAGIAAEDVAVLSEWRSVIDSSDKGEMRDESFCVCAARMFENWKGHDREAMETWLAGAYMHPNDSEDERPGTLWWYRLIMSEGAVRCALKLGDVETARKVITVLNDCFSKGGDETLKSIRHIGPALRLLENTLDQKQPELARILLETVEAIITSPSKPYLRSQRERLDKIKQRLSEGK